MRCRHTSVVIEKCEASRAEVERMRTLVVEACGIADLALPTVPCDMSFEVARIAAIRAEVGK